MDPSELGSFLTGIRYHILTLIGNKEGLVVRHLQSPLGPVFVEKWSKDQGCLILQSQMFKVWWDDGGHHELLYQVQDQAGNREDCYEKGRGPGRQLQSGWVLMVKSSKSRCQSWKRVTIVQICVGQRFANLLWTVLQNTIMQCTRYSSDVCFIH